MKIKSMILIIILASMLNCATAFNMVACVHCGHDSERIPLDTITYVIDSAIAYPIITASSVPSLGWFYFGIASIYYVIMFSANILSEF